MNAFEKYSVGFVGHTGYELAYTKIHFNAGMTAACDIARIYGKSFYDKGNLASAAFILNVIALIEEERDGK